MAILAHANVAIRGAIEVALRDDAHWRVLGVSNGGEAVRVALTLMPQVVLIDPYLQGMDGVATIVALRAHGIVCPVIALLEQEREPSHVWQDRGFAGIIELSPGFSLVVSQLHVLMPVNPTLL